MTTLKEILSEEAKILDLVITNGGELSEEQSQELDAVMTALCQKVDAYAATFDALEARVESLKRQAAMFTDAAKALKNAQERLKERMKYLIQESGKNGVEGDYWAFKLSSGKPSLVINDELDPSYLMQVTEMVADKKRIEDDLRLGIPIKGAAFKETVVLRKSVRK